MVCISTKPCPQCSGKMNFLLVSSIWTLWQASDLSSLDTSLDDRWWKECVQKALQSQPNRILRVLYMILEWADCQLTQTTFFKWRSQTKPNQNKKSSYNYPAINKLLHYLHYLFIVVVWFPENVMKMGVDSCYTCGVIVAAYYMI